jgi:hypothetical protein
MRSRFAIAFVALSFALSCFSSHAGAQVASHVQQLQPDPYGLRGWIAQDHVRVTVNGIPVAYQWVDFYGYALGAFGNPGVGVRYLGSAHTDANGARPLTSRSPTTRDGATSIWTRSTGARRRLTPASAKCGCVLVQPSPIKATQV